MTNFLIGFVVGVGIAWLAYRAGSLNRSGAISAAVLGTIIFGLGGIGWAVVLLTFFISSSLLSKSFKAKKVAVGQNFAKGNRRDAAQVLANGGTAGGLTLAFFMLTFLTPGNSLLPHLWVGFAASLAGANADTWATELGVLNPKLPVLLTTFKPVPQGTSGGVSQVGTTAALAGSALVGGMAVLSSWLGYAPAVSLPLWTQFLVIVFGGLLGSFIDSWLGATIQAVYFCPVCQKETERFPTHFCGTPTTLSRGLAWLNNDWVNTACTLSAGLTGILLSLVYLLLV